MSHVLIESKLQEAALSLFMDLAHAIYGFRGIASGESSAEEADYRETVLVASLTKVVLGNSRTCHAGNTVGEAV